jgi:hypothetical protein
MRRGRIFTTGISPPESFHATYNTAVTVDQIANSILALLPREDPAA